MALLATVDELELRLDDTLDPDAATQALTLASGEVIAYTGNRFLEAELVAELNGTGSAILLLPDVPVATVTEVLEAPGRSTEAVIPDTAYDWDADGVVELVAGRWHRRRRWYRVTYTAGYEAVPDAVKSVVFAMAGRSLSNPEGLKQESLGRYSYTVAGDAGGVGLYAPERRILDTYYVSSKLRETPTTGPVGS